MEYRQVGNTELRVSEIGFGCGGNAGLMVRGSPEEQRRVVTRAIELGINYFDNAPDYGNGVAEENLGRVLKELKLRPVITSKVEVRHTDLGDIAGHVVRSTEESLQRLGVDYVDILQIHNGPAPAPPQLEGRSYTQLWIEDYLRPGGALEGLQRVLRDGKARYVGFICRGQRCGPGPTAARHQRVSHDQCALYSAESHGGDGQAQRAGSGAGLRRGDSLRL